MGEYSQEEVDRLAAEVKDQLYKLMDQARDIADALEWMAEHYRPEEGWEHLRHRYKAPALLELTWENHFDLDPHVALRAMSACTDEHFGLKWEQEHSEEVAS